MGFVLIFLMVNDLSRLSNQENVQCFTGFCSAYMCGEIESNVFLTFLSAVLNPKVIYPKVTDRPNSLEYETRITKVVKIIYSIFQFIYKEEHNESTIYFEGKPVFLPILCLDMVEQDLYSCIGVDVCHRGRINEAMKD